MALNDAIIPESLDYTDKDFEAVRRRLFDVLGSVFPEWKEDQPGAFGTIILEMFAFVADILTGYQDQQALEGKLATVTQRKEAIKLLELINYRMSGQSAAQVDEVITVQGELAAAVRLNAGTLVKTRDAKNPIKYQLLENVDFIPGGDSSQTVTCENSQTAKENYAPTAAPNQTVKLSKTPFLESADEEWVIASNIEGEWTVQESLLESGPNDRHCMVRVDQFDQATVSFGDGVNGAIPKTSLAFEYKYGGGASGRVDKNALTVLEGTHKDSEGNTVNFTVNNPSKSSGGENRETINAAKLLGPASLRATRRTVSREDYEIQAVKGGAGRALMLTSDEVPWIDENSGRLYVVGPSGEAMTEQQLEDIKTRCTVLFPNTLTFRLEVFNAIFKTCDVRAVVHFATGYSKTSVKETVVEDLGTFFSPKLSDGTPNPKIDFGYNMKNHAGESSPEVAFSDVYNVVRDVTGIRKISPNVGDFTINGVQYDVVLQSHEFPVLGEVIIIDGETNLTL